MDGLLGYSKKKTHALKKTQAYTKSMNIEIQKQPSRVVLKIRCLKIYSKFTGEHPCQSVICKAILLKSHLGMGVLL